MRSGHLTFGMRLFIVAVLLAVSLAIGNLIAAPTPAPTAKKSLSAVDTDGHTVTIPSEGRATVLVFIMTEQPQSQKAVEEVAAALGAYSAGGLPAGRQVQVVMVLSGQQPEAAAKTLKSKLPGSVVIDADYALAGKMSVRAWPTTLVILPDGEELGHLAGLAQSFGKDLSCYLDFVAGKIDRETLKSRISSSQVVADDAHQMAMRHLEVAERQLAKGLLTDAQQELEKGLKLDPRNADLQLANARLLLLRGQPEQAMAALDKMDPASAAPWRVDTLRGRCLVALKQWDTAATVLARAVRLNPEPGEAYYALGLLYEQRGDWTSAAKAFRSAFESTPAGRAVTVPETPSGAAPPKP
jgi:tetratricopeptide (TPR) repeat protein